MSSSRFSPHEAIDFVRPLLCRRWALSPDFTAPQSNTRDHRVAPLPFDQDRDLNPERSRSIKAGAPIIAVMMPAGSSRRYNAATDRVGESEHHSAERHRDRKAFGMARSGKEPSRVGREQANETDGSDGRNGDCHRDGGIEHRVFARISRREAQ